MKVTFEQSNQYFQRDIPQKKESNLRFQKESVGEKKSTCFHTTYSYQDVVYSGIPPLKIPNF